MQITTKLDQHAERALKALGLEFDAPIQFERPTDWSHGDWSTNLALVLFKKQQKYTSPKALAEALVAELKKTSISEVEKIEVAGPGFINFFLSKAFLLAETVSLVENQAKLIQQKNSGKKAIVEFSSPNIAKPFTIGHLRSTIIGWAIANLLEETGYKVFRDNHLGDWGTQFGKQIYALTYLGEGSLKENIAKISASANPVKDLVALYVEFHNQAESKPELEDEARAIFKRLEDGDKDMYQIWQMCIDWSFVEFDRIYQLLGVKFTENDGRGFGESYFEDKMGVVIDELTNISQKSDKISFITGDNGAKLVEFDSKIGLPPLMILKSDGATLYATRDLATDKWRLAEYGQDTLIVNEVGAEQSLYFEQIFAVEEALGWVKPGQRVHVGHGMYRFKDGKMSTRKGNVIWLEDVLEEAERRAWALSSRKHEIEFEGSLVRTRNKKQAEHSKTYAEISNDNLKIAFGALKWADLKRSARLDVAFDWDEIMSMQGNSGPYLQYGFVRCQSILKKADILDITKQSDLLLDIKSYLKNEAEIDFNDDELHLLRNLSMYFEVVEKSAHEFAPHHLATYLFNLTQVFNQFYVNNQVLGVGENTQAQRLFLVLATSLILQKGLKILGIEVVEKM